MPYNFELPPTITGKTPDEQIKQLQNYIYKLVQDLNYFAERGSATSKGLTLDELSLKLESNTETINDKADKSSVKKVEKKATTIEANVDGFRAEVSKTYTTIEDTNSLKKRVTAAESAIEVNAEGIKTKVAKDGVMSAIEQSPEDIRITANKVDIDNLFSQNINMSGTFTATAQAYLPPTWEELERVKRHIFRIETIPDDEFEKYDVNGNGVINTNDFTMFKQVLYGMWDVKETFPNMPLSPVTVTINPSDPEKMITLEGVNWWGTDVSMTIGSFGLTTYAANIKSINFHSLTGENYSGEKALVTDSNEEIVESDVTSKELGYLSGVTSNIQTQLNDKAPTSHTHTKSQITDFPTSMPASDVYSWAKASTKPSYAWSEITDKPAIPNEIAYLNGVTGNIQEQLDNKASSSDLDGIASSIQAQLDARKITWECPTKVGEYSTLCFLDRQYASYLLNIRFFQTNQALSHTYLITQGYGTASITQVGGSGFKQNTDLSIRLVQDSRYIETWVELLNNFSYDGTDTIIAHCSCTPLSDMGTCTGYTTYTEPVGGTVVDEITSIPSGLAGLLGKVVYEVDPNTTNGIYCNGKTTADSVNSITISDQWKRYKRLKIYARFPHGKCIQEFDLVMSNQGTNSYGNSSGSIVSFSSDNASGVNNHYLVQMNFCVNEINNGWTLQVIESGWIHLGLPPISTSHFTSNATTAVTGTSYTKWNQRHNSDYCIYKIVGYED